MKQVIIALGGVATVLGQFECIGEGQTVEHTIHGRWLNYRGAWSGDLQGCANYCENRVPHNGCQIFQHELSTLPWRAEEGYGSCKFWGLSNRDKQGPEKAKDVLSPCLKGEACWDSLYTGIKNTNVYFYDVNYDGDSLYDVPIRPIAACGAEPPPGCQMATAINYNPSASEDDGSCLLNCKQLTNRIMLNNYCLDSVDEDISHCKGIIHGEWRCANATELGSERWPQCPENVAEFSTTTTREDDFLFVSGFGDGFTVPVPQVGGIYNNGTQNITAVAQASCVAPNTTGFNTQGLPAQPTMSDYQIACAKAYCGDGSWSDQETGFVSTGFDDCEACFDEWGDFSATWAEGGDVRGKCQAPASFPAGTTPDGYYHWNPATSEYHQIKRSGDDKTQGDYMISGKMLSTRQDDGSYRAIGPAEGLFNRAQNAAPLYASAKYMNKLVVAYPVKSCATAVADLEVGDAQELRSAVSSKVMKEAALDVIVDEVLDQVA